jgi:hypothetical protein
LRGLTNGQAISWSALAGVAAMVALMPLNTLIARRITQLRLAIMKVTDERVKWTNEILLGVLLGLADPDAAVLTRCCEQV